MAARDDDATRAVAEALCTSVTDPAALVLERRRLASSDLSNLINTWCASGSPEPALTSATRQVRIQLNYRAVGDSALAERWQEAGLVVDYSKDSAGRISVEFDEEQVAAIARLQLAVDRSLSDGGDELCH